MNLGVKTGYEELCLGVRVKTLRPIKIRIKVWQKDRPKTVFTNRFKTVNGEEFFYIRMPITPKEVVLTVFNEANGNLRKNQDTSFMVTDVLKIPLEKRTDVGDIRNITVQEFVDFAQRFSFNASYLKDNTNYQSSSGQFLIEYLPTIIGKNNRELKTPARISKANGRIQVSKKAFDQYTVPMRMAILLHEFSHFYLNKDMDDETEADLNGLLIYLGLGYPRIEGYEAYLHVFEGTPSMQNKERYDIINKFIRNFEQKKMKLIRYE